MAGETVVAGIDEAGYGPTLGPLVVSAVEFSLPDDYDAAELWRAFAPAIRRPGVTPRNDGGLWLGDSKAVYSRALGVGRLETTVLAFASRTEKCPADVRSAFADWLLDPRVTSHLDSCPWYADWNHRLPCEAEPAAVTSGASSLRNACVSAGIKMPTVRCALLPAGIFNMQIERTGNKAEMLFDQAAKLMRWVFDRHPGEMVRVFVDRLGGRKCYEPLLASAFDGVLLSTLKETAEESAYRAWSTTARGTVNFCVKGDVNHLPIALASMFSKYIRELCMAQFNRFWQEYMPGLATTAGYPEDARRFLDETAALRRRLSIEPQHLIRSR